MKPGLSLRYVPLADLVPPARNPKRHDEAALEASIERFGYAVPIVRDGRTGRIVAGNGRRDLLLAMEQRGEKAPAGILVVKGRWAAPVVEGWASKDDAEAEAFLIAENAIGPAGGVNLPELGRMISDLRARVDFSTLGFDKAAIERAIKSAHDAARPRDKDAAPRPEPEPAPGFDEWYREHGRKGLRAAQRESWVACLASAPKGKVAGK